MAHLFDLTGKTAVVTGAHGGLGRGMAEALAAHGADIVGVDIRPQDDTAAAIARLGRRYVGHVADLGRSEVIAPLVDRIVDKVGKIDILVNNAGIIRRADLLDFSEKDWDEVIDVNLKAVFFLSQAVARHMIDAGIHGRLIATASLLSFQGGIRVPSYTASKSGVAGLTKLLANELAPHNITANAIAPGYMETDNTAALRADPVRTKALMERIPFARFGRPDDLATAVVFLAAPASRYVTGVVLPVDGGWLAR